MKNKFSLSEMQKKVPDVPVSKYCTYILDRDAYLYDEEESVYTKVNKKPLTDEQINHIFQLAEEENQPIIMRCSDNFKREGLDGLMKALFGSGHNKNNGDAPNKSMKQTSDGARKNNKHRILGKRQISYW